MIQPPSRKYKGYYSIDLVKNNGEKGVLSQIFQFVHLEMAA
jgi:hypothetical protein